MKTATIIITLVFLTIGCTNQAQDKRNIATIDSNKTASHKMENSLVYFPNEALWEYDYDSIIKKFKVYKIRPFSTDTLSAQKIEHIINATWPKVQIKYLRTSKDTVFITIPNSEVLTQQMGTTGADQFIISTTFSFTELTKIKYVSFSFESGDHANPGTYSRHTWNELVIQDEND